MLNVRTVAEQKRVSVDEAWQTGVREALNWICFAIDEANERKRQMEEWRRRH